MKNKNATTEKWFRIGDHKIIAIRMIAEGENIHFEIEQVISNEKIPFDKRKQINIDNASVFKMGLEKSEFYAILSVGADFLKLIKK